MTKKKLNYFHKTLISIKHSALSIFKFLYTEMGIVPFIDYPTYTIINDAEGESDEVMTNKPL